jgi:ubiquinone/menaquinone biosynthesis C-methylase UbiE
MEGSWPNNEVRAGRGCPGRVGRRRPGRASLALYDLFTERYVIRGGRLGYDRLRVLAAARRASTLELFQLAGLRPGMRCVDVGCGSGDVTLDMAVLVGPAGWVVGIDIDQAKLEFAREAARGRGLANVAFETADVNQWTGPGQYDFVYCRFLLQHLAWPAGLLSRMWDAAARAAS